MKARRSQAKDTESRPRRPQVRRAHARLAEMAALGGDYLFAVTSGASPDDDAALADLRGFHFFGMT
jgi:hypothetical protein